MLGFLFHSPCPLVFFALLLFEEIGIPLHILIERSWNFGSREIGILHSSFWRNYWIFGFSLLVNEMIKEVTVWKEDYRIDNRPKVILSNAGEIEIRCKHTHSKQE